MDKNIRNAGIFGIINLIFVIPIFLIEIARNIFPVTTKLIVISLIINLIYVISYILFIRGFVIIGKKLKISSLVKSSYAFIIISVPLIIFQILNLSVLKIFSLVSSIIMLIVVGIIGIFFGISLLKLKKKFGKIATATGILNIIAGAGLASVVLIVIPILILLPSYILEIMLLFRASRKL